MATYDSLAQLEAMVNASLVIALDKTMDRLLIELQNIIEKTVYDWESPSSIPWSINRTGQFLDSWQVVSSQIVGLMVQSEINQAIDVMKQFFIGDKEVHEDRENLAEIINSGVGYNFGQAEGVERDFWNQFETYVETNLFRIFKEECMSVGLPITTSITAKLT